MIRNSIIFLLTVIMIGCGRISIHNYKAHDREGLSANKLAILHVTRHNFVREIDGKGQYSPSSVSDLFPYSGARIELLPGTHTLSLEYQSSSLRSTEKSKINYRFLPGKEYFLHSTTDVGFSKSKNLQYYIKFHISECGSKEEKAYNEKESKNDFWLNPFVPACGPES